MPRLVSGWTSGVARRWVPMLPAAVVGLVTTVVVLPAGLLPAAFRAPQVHLALETANVLVGLLVALLVYGRYRADRRLDQLLLIDALLALAAANVALAVSAGLGESATADTLRWASVGGRLLGSGLLCASALATPRVRVAPGGAVVLHTGLGLLLAGAVVTLGVALAPPVRDVSTGVDTATPALEMHPAVVVAQGLGVALLFTAAAVLTRRAVLGADDLTRWLAAGTILAAFARVHFLFYPSLLSDVVYTGDALRAGFYGCLLVGALREIEGYWRLRARAAVADERRRIARDLHDGMTQELTFILAQTRTLAAGAPDTLAVARIEDATTRALDEARRAIDALDSDSRRPFEVELRGVAADLAGRYDLRVTVDEVDEGLEETTAGTAEQLLRIVGEAVRNAARHGRAHCVRISLRRGGRMEAMAHELTVTDDGVGFDPSCPRLRDSGGYGLVSMRDRASAIGGTLSVESRPGRGTTVTVAW